MKRVREPSHSPEPLRAHPEFLSTDGTADSHRNKRQRHSLLAEEHDTSALPAQVIQSKNAEATSPTSLSALNNRKHSLSEISATTTVSSPFTPHHADPPLPLTKDNLRIHNGADMTHPDPPLTPSSTAKSKASTPTASSKPRRTEEVRVMLHNNKLLVNEHKETDLHKQVLEKAEQILQGERGSEMRPGSLEDIVHVQKEEATSNEMTFLVEFWKTLVRKRRHVRPSKMQTLGSPLDQEIAGETYSDAEDTTVDADNGGQCEETNNAADDLSDPEAWTERLWDKDHLKCNWAADFRSQSVPRLRAADGQASAVLAKLLGKYPRLKTPRPDLTYGLKRSAFTEEEQQINDTSPTFSEVSNKCFHAYFIVECKTDGRIEDAENQACRGGATLVNARRQFDNECSAQGGAVGADLSSIVFSLVLIPSLAHLYVHWAEVKAAKRSANKEQEEVVYHMTLVETYSLMKRGGKELQRLRHDINNIFDWGTLKRKQEIQDVMKTLTDEIQQSSKKQKAG